MHREFGEVWMCGCREGMCEQIIQTDAHCNTPLSMLVDIEVTLKMHDLKMTDKENYGSGKCKTGK